METKHDFAENESWRQSQCRNLPAKRGAIVDRNGKPLAEDGHAAQISVVPGQLGGSSKKQTINKLADYLGISPKLIYQELSASWVKPDSLVPVKTIDASKTALIKKATKLPGVSEQDVASRVYPDKEASAHLTGYVGPITAELLKKHKNEGYTQNSEIGRTGLEQIFEKKLHKQDGAVIHLLNSSGEETGIIARKNPLNGQDVRLTIDLKVQDALYKEMKGESGSAVAINPKTGDVLGLVSTPAFNPNDFVHGLSNSAYNKLNNDPGKPLLNRFTGSFTPGSVFKPITAAIALNNQAIDPNQKVAIVGKKWKKRTVPGAITMLHGSIVWRPSILKMP
ncbi:penicillin-binding transpeptidase domain-containing protein [Terrilactibacillus sp. S3-3]|nr:penicillin-binding transpeptidase domain-containing protein [Terrilactibacillus sp. S3-3]